MGQPRFLIVSRPPQPDLAAGGIVWRLLGANNRHLGQSERRFAELTDCLAAIGRLQLGLDRARPAVAGVEHGQLWRWRLEIDGEPVASSTRAYRRQRECQYSLGLFLAGARSAEPAPRPPVALPRQAGGPVRTPARPALRGSGA
ncbi:DUF1508 domain-containing protein [Streptomyces sp. TLI_171]|uniref:DUF1508 domain-containing protein n=1 Tax=Streptomyces sp. TLI_171 TaxID=1938859 RepID=UPI000C17A242|nr:DUF1508 domain-containing protein [Streptomyces sp. TLI_171]RKE19019.1 hypothetical protein BX266_2320 [Streptomyces sp. TLI_171]